MEIVMLPRSALRGYEQNSRTHSPEQIAQLTESIKAFGFTNPILIAPDRTIIAGHGRLAAAEAAGLDEVPTITLDHLTEAQRRAYVIADNKLALNAGWDMDVLRAEMEAIAADGEVDLGLLGFSEGELSEILPIIDIDEDQNGDPDASPPVQSNPVSAKGDVWILGNHRVMCGDSTSTSSFEVLMSGIMADMIFTDPPYGMSYGGGRAAGDHAIDKKTGGVKIKSHGMIINDDLQGDDLIALVRDAIATSSSYMKKGGALHACFTWRTYAEFEKGLESCGHKVKACIVWDKKSIGLGNSNYRPQHEFIFYCSGNWYGDKSESDVWYMSRGNTSDYVHPTQKPVELVERALCNSSKIGDTVIDCFGGSGSTLIACEKSGRNARIMELDPKILRCYSSPLGIVYRKKGNSRIEQRNIFRS